MLARLANFLDGHAAVRPEIAEAVAAMLDGDGLSPVPSAGIGGAGEIQSLSHLFAPLDNSLALQVKEGLALINGAPCSAALLADATLASVNRCSPAEEIFALAAEAFLMPLEHVAPEFEELWEDAAEAATLAALRRLLEGGARDRRPYQAPVSFRILPRLLARYRRAIAEAERASAVSLPAVTDNPVFLPPDEQHTLGRVASNGGFQNAMAWPAMDELAAVAADLCTLAERHGAKLLTGQISLLPDQLQDGPDDERYFGCLSMAAVGHAEAARHAAQRTFLPASESGGFGQNDVASPTFFAWQRQQRAGQSLEAGLATLSLIASQALHVTGRDAPPALRPVLAEIRKHVPPLEAMRPLGPEAERLARAFAARVLETDETAGVMR